MGKTSGGMDDKEDSQASGGLDGGGMGRAISEGVRGRVKERVRFSFFFFYFFFFFFFLIFE